LSYDPNNVFARILRGELPCRKVYEDELSISTSAYAGREPGTINDAVLGSMRGQLIPLPPRVSCATGTAFWTRSRPTRASRGVDRGRRQAGSD
jgi:hypothetical protein